MTLSREELEAHWMPFTGNRQFKDNPRLLERADGVYYYDTTGRQIFDGLSGLWTCGAGHNRPEIVEAVSRQVSRLDYSPGFQYGHPLSFQLANKIVALTPPALDHVFFTDSGSETVDTALKIARAYWRNLGMPGKTRFIGRQKGYHGVNYGGVGVGGIGFNRKLFGQTIEADHLPHTALDENRFSRGMPDHGAHLADELEQLVLLHDASNIAAVIVEPLSGTAGVLPPPKGYLNRLREICDRYGILLIFDEVITGFGRLGTPFAAQWAGVVPDLMALAKGITNGAVPMGAVLAHERVFDAFMTRSPDAIEFAHGYTYSAHPLACAAGLATLEVYRAEGLFERVNQLWPTWDAAAHALDHAPHVLDVRTIGLLCAIDVAPREGASGARAADIARSCLDAGVLVRASGDTIVLSPPLVISGDQIRIVFDALSHALSITP